MKACKTMLPIYHQKKNNAQYNNYNLPKILLYFLEINIMIKPRRVNNTYTATRSVDCILIIIDRLKRRK